MKLIKVPNSGFLWVLCKGAETKDLACHNEDRGAWVLTPGTANTLKKKFFFKEKLGDNDSLYKDYVKGAGCQCHCEGRVRCKWFSAGPVVMGGSSDEAKVNDWRTVTTMIEMNWTWTNIPRAPLAATPSNGADCPRKAYNCLKSTVSFWEDLGEDFLNLRLI